MKITINIFIAVGLVFCQSACWVKEEAGKRMQADIAALQVELDVVKKAHSNQKAELQKRILEADKQIVELVKIIGEYRRATGRNAADVGVDIERIKTQLMEIKGRLEVNEHRLDEIEKNLSAVHKDVSEKISTAQKLTEEEAEKARLAAEAEKNKKPPDPLAAIKRPEKKENFYKLAYGLLEAGQVVAARALFEEFLEKWPKDAYSDNALYWIGESYYAEKDFRLAALTFQRVRTDFVKGDKSKDALLKLGFCFFAMEKYKESLPFLKEFVRRFPKTKLAKKARKKIKEAEKKIKKSK
jgi:tol-pal system protein YbgF